MNVSRPETMMNRRLDRIARRSNVSGRTTRLMISLVNIEDAALSSAINVEITAAPSPAMTSPSMPAGIRSRRSIP